MWQKDQITVSDLPASQLPPAEVAQLAVHHTPQPVFMLDQSATIVYANPAATSFLRGLSQQLVGMPFVDTLDTGSRAKGLAMLGAVADAPPVPFELNQICGGEIVTVAYRAVALPDSSGGKRVLLFGEPRTSVVATTTRLLALNQRLQSLFRVAASTSRSPELESMLGQMLVTVKRELDLRAAAVLLQGEQGLVLAAHHGFYQAEGILNDAWLGRIAEHAIVVDGMVLVEGEASAFGFDLAHVPEAFDPYWKLAIAPIRNDAEVAGQLLILTDRYRAFEREELDFIQAVGNLIGPAIRHALLFDRLQERSGQLQSVLDSIDGGVLLTDTSGIVRYANRRLGALLQTNVDAWPGQPRAAVVPTTLRPTVQVQPLFDGDLWETEGDERRILRRYHDTVSDDEQHVIGEIDVYSDVTQAQQLAQIKDEFIAAAAHDLKTPVTAIKGYAQMALRLARKQDDQRMAHQLDLLNELSDDLTHHMEVLLDMSRLQAGRLHLDVDTAELSEIVNRAARHFGSVLQRQQRNLILDLPVEPVEVEWDNLRIERVLINLISNALKYSPDGGDVRLSARPLEQRTSPAIEITVTDHGIGIPPEEREHVFERFYRTPQVVSEGFKGTGLGLYLCRQIVEAHGGKICAEPARHGEAGTTLVLILPTHPTLIHEG